MQRLNRAIARVLPDSVVEKIRRARGNSIQDDLRTELQSLKKELFDLRADHMRLAQLMDTVEQLILDNRDA